MSGFTGTLVFGLIHAYYVDGIMVRFSCITPMNTVYKEHKRRKRNDLRLYE